MNYFDTIAPRYDYWKQKNSYYYDSLKNLLKEFVPPHEIVFDFGCGTGDLLHSLLPKVGVGYDTSEEMLKIARRKYPQYIFTSKLGSFEPRYTICMDVIAHVNDLKEILKFLSTVGGKIILTTPNYKWEPLLMLLEKLGLKMPEGPHERINSKVLRNLIETNNLHILASGRTFLIPLKSMDWLNRLLKGTSLMQGFGLIEYYYLSSNKKYEHV